MPIQVVDNIAPNDVDATRRTKVIAFADGLMLSSEWPNIFSIQFMNNIQERKKWI